MSTTYAESPQTNSQEDKLPDEHKSFSEKSDHAEAHTSDDERAACKDSVDTSDISTDDEGNTYPEGGLRAWLVVVGAFSGMMACFGYMNTVGTYQAYLAMNQLSSYSESTIGWIFSVYIFLSFGAGVQVGPFFDKHGPFWLVVIGSICLLLSIMLLGVCSQYCQCSTPCWKAFPMLNVSLTKLQPTAAKSLQTELCERLRINGEDRADIRCITTRALHAGLWRAWRNRHSHDLHSGCIISGTLVLASQSQCDWNCNMWRSTWWSDVSCKPDQTTGSADVRLLTMSRLPSFPLMLQDLFPKIGWAWATRIQGFIFILLLLVAILLLRARLPPRPGGSAWPDVSVFKDLPFALVTAGAYFLEWGLFIPVAYLTSYALDTDGAISPTFAYQLLAIFNAGSFFGRWVPGYVADKLGRFNTQIVAVFLCAASSLALWLPAAVYATSESGSSPRTILALTIVYAALMGFASGSNISLTPVCVGMLCPTKDYGRYIATTYTIVSLGCLTGLPIAGALISATGGSYWAVALFTGGCYICGLCCFVAVRVMKAGWKLAVIY